jgi:exo-beta-1,3-glucanase (GH17 family)
MRLLVLALALATAGPDRPGPIAGAGPADRTFLDYLSGRPTPTLVCYSPTGYVPGRGPDRKVPGSASVRADLEALRPAFDGLILYGYDRDLTPIILEEARRARYRAVLLGAWDPRDQAELEGVVDLVRRYRDHLALAVVLGNEGINFNRYREADLIAAASRVAARLGPRATVPLTTSEPFNQYGQEFLLGFGDFLAPNIHPFFDSGIYDRPVIDPRRTAADAALWARGRGLALARAAGKPVLVKETGIPHTAPGCSPEAQRAFWAAYLASDRLVRVADPPGAWVCHAAAFEAFDDPDKARRSGMSVEGAWGLLSASRTPHPALSVFAKQNRSETNTPPEE